MRLSAAGAALGGGLERGLPSLADDLCLLVNELVTNAIQHGGGCRDFRMSRTTSGVRVEVQQVASGSPRVRRPSADQERGSGLLMVERLADTWGMDLDGMTAWFTLATQEES
jgi:two-component sensor histidine kinase